MGEIVASIRHGFGNLLRFSGRDTRGQFWPYAIFIFIAASLVSYLAMIPELTRMMQNMLQIAAEQSNASGPPSPEEIDALARRLMPNFEFMMLATLIVDIVAVALLAAAVTRRLHDRDRVGLWGLLPLPGFAIGFAIAPAMFESVRRPAAPDVNMAMLVMLTNFVSWGLLVFLIVLLAREGTSGPNRFGAAPQPEPR